MPDIAATASNNNCTTKTSSSVDVETSSTSSSNVSPPPPASGVKVHQIASMFSSLQQSTQQQQHHRRSTITNVVLTDKNETIFRPDSLPSRPSTAVDEDANRHRTTSSGGGVKKRFMPTRSRSTDSRSNVAAVSSTIAGEDLHFLDHREKFSSAKALFENLERASRDQKRTFNGRQTENFGHKSNSSASKRGSSTSPQRRPPPPPSLNSMVNTSIISSSSTVVTVIETRTQPFTKISNEKIASPRSPAVVKNIHSPHVRSPPPPIPPKPKSLCSPNVVEQARHKFNFNNVADDKDSSTTGDGGGPIDDGSLDRATKELNDLMNSLERMTIFPSTNAAATATVGENSNFNKNCSSPTAAAASVVNDLTTTPKLNGVEKQSFNLKVDTNGGLDETDRSTTHLRHNQIVNNQKTLTKINQNELPSPTTSTLVTNVKQPSSSSSPYEPYWRQPNYHTKRNLASTNSESGVVEEVTSMPSPSSRIVVEVSSSTTRQKTEEETRKKPSPSSAHLTSMRDDDSKDSGIGSDSACSANLLEFGGGTATPKASADDGLTVEPVAAATTTTNGSAVEYMTLEEKKNLLSPATQAILRRPPTGKTSTTDDGERISLPSHLAIPHDVNNKRLSMCSMTSETNEHTILSSERYSMVDEMDVHWISDDQFYVEIDGLGDDEIVDEAPSGSAAVVIDYKKPSRVRFNTKRLKVYSTYSGVEYDRRNEDIDPVAASAEYELERRLEKMDIFEINLDKGMDGLGFSIIGMGVGADAGLEKLGIFVKSITPGGAVFRDGRICVCDQIVEVDGKSLVGVSQTYAANVLRSTSGHVNFKIGRERDLDSSEIAQLIRQSLDQDQAANAREQAILCERLNMSPSLNANGQSSSSLPPPKPPAWGPSRNTPLPSSDSVFEDDDKTPDDNPRLQELMNQLKKQESKDVVDRAEITPINRSAIVSSSPAVAAPSAPPIENPAFHVEPTSPSESEELQNFTAVTDEINKFLYADDTTDVEDKMANALHVKENSGGYVARRQLAETKSNSTDSMDDDEHGLVLRIGNLETTLNDVKKEADKYQQLLTNSQDHYDDLDQRYKTAKKKIKDYQERERDLLEREEIHLQQLREKDAQYAALVKQLNDKVVELEKQLTDAQRKRASLAESASLSSMGAAMNGSVATATDMSSPAMAYLPAKKPTRSVQIAPDDQKPSTSGVNEHRTTIEVGSEIEVSYVDGVRHDFGVPYTQLLDSSAAKSKAEAVRQSVIMSARSLPSRHADAEVYVTCHHTMEHAEILKTQPSHLMTESSSGTVLQSAAATTSNNKNSPSKSSSTSASTSSGSPLSSRRILDLINFRKKAASNVNKDLEQAIRGGGDFERVPEVLQWTCDDVFKFLHSLGLNKYEPEFKINRIDGCKLLQLDGSKLKSMGVANHNDRAIIKKRVKDMKMQIEKERKKENRKLLQKFDKDRKTSKC